MAQQARSLEKKIGLSLIGLVKLPLQGLTGIGSQNSIGVYAYWL
jgi:hypothetical protein